jgi:hypothetical protein
MHSQCIASDAFGTRSQALLWMSVAPRNLRDTGQVLASRPEFPFVAATTGSTNLVAALVCPDDRSLYEYLTDEMTGLDATHIETAPVMQFVKMHATMAPRQRCRERWSTGLGPRLSAQPS